MHFFIKKIHRFSRTGGCKQKILLICKTFEEHVKELQKILICKTKKMKSYQCLNCCTNRGKL